MKKLNVLYAGWGERWQLGVLAEEGRELIFEYSPQAIARGLELSPFKMQLSSKSFANFPDYQHRLPGFISDALPDGWGMLLMNRFFRTQGRVEHLISPLDRLAFIGDKAMGALAFEPAESEILEPCDVELLDIAQDVRKVMVGESESLLRKMVLMGGSPQGARPKVLVNFDRASNQMSNSATAGGTPLLVKFPAQHEHKEVCAIEVMYGKIARACGIQVPVMEFFNLNQDLAAFGIERFDRTGGMRIPMLTAAGAAHIDYRTPQLHYTALLRLTQFLTRDIREVVKAFERCIFNVIYNNRDDHSKNFSFIMGIDGRWKFSPAYDLTYSAGPNGEHQMDLCGEARKPARKQLLQLARDTGIAETTAVNSIDRIAAVAEHFSDFADELPIRVETLKTIQEAVNSNHARVR